jgi:hypothetical protein
VTPVRNLRRRFHGARARMIASLVINYFLSGIMTPTLPVLSQPDHSKG